MPIRRAATLKPPRIPKSKNLPGQTVIPGMTALEPAKKQQETPEYLEQSTLYIWLDMWKKKHPELWWVFAIPNGLALDGKTAVKAKKQGVRSGIWDIQVPFPRMLRSRSEEGEEFCPALWIEMKIRPNKLTDEQKAFRAALQPHGHRFVVCYTWIDAAYCITRYLGIDDPMIDQVLTINRKASIRYATPLPGTHSETYTGTSTGESEQESHDEESNP